MGASFYVGKTGLQADKLISPHKGRWLETSGTISMLHPDGKGAVCMLTRDSRRPVECRFSERWVDRLDQCSNGDTLQVVGKIAPHQNGAQLYLLECEISEVEVAKPIEMPRPIEHESMINTVETLSRPVGPFTLSVAGPTGVSSETFENLGEAMDRVRTLNPDQRAKAVITPTTGETIYGSDIS
jgi:hypothetical protein